MKHKNILTKAFTMLIVALFGLTEASAQTIVSDVTASHIGPTSVNLSWSGSARYLRFRTEGTSTTYNFDNSTLEPWTTFSNATSQGERKFVWDVNSTNQTYRSYQAGTGHGRNGSADMVISGSYCSNSNDNTYYGEDLTPNNFLVSPQITLGGTISFWAKGMDPSACEEQFGVFYSTNYNANSPRNATWTQVGSTKTTTSEWTQYVFDLGSLTGTGYVAIRHYNCTGQDLLCVDDIVITVPDATWSNDNIIDMGSNLTSYTLSGLTETTGYQVEVGTRRGQTYTWSKGTRFSTTNNNPAPAELSASPVGQNTATINWFGLSGNYKVEYKKDAKDGPQYFFDDFEDGLSNWTYLTEGSGDGWHSFDLTGSTSGYKYRAHSGKNVARAQSWTNSLGDFNADNWLITPKLTFGPKLKFWVHVNAGYPDKYEVKLSTSGTAIDNFTVSLRDLAAAEPSDEWERVSIDIPAQYVDTDGYIAIHHEMYGGDVLCIDDFGLFDDDVSGSGGWTEVTTSNLSQDLEGLIPNTQYEYRVSSISGSDVATSEIYTFTTEPLDDLELVDDGENSETIRTLSGASNIDVTLKGRTIVGGKWNTLCLPFTVTRISNSPLAGADVRQLTSASFDADNNKTLKLTFSTVTKIEAGVPYIIKPSSDIEAPEFSGMQIREGLSPKKCEFDVNGETVSITFRGTYDKITDFVEQLPGVNSRQSILLINANGNFQYPGASAWCNAQRGVFILSGISMAASSSNTIKAFVADFAEEDATGIAELFNLTDEAGIWYDLNGRKLAGKPAQKGVYINNGKKTIIK